MLLDAGIGDAETIERAHEASDGFGRILLSLAGFDRQAVSAACAQFSADGTAPGKKSSLVIEKIGGVLWRERANYC